MSFIAIVGAGAIGGALAHRLAGRDRVTEVRLIDSDGNVARGKALDIRQSSPIQQFSTRLTGADQLEAAAGASAIVIADTAAGDVEHSGEPALATVKRLAAIDTSAPLVFAGATQRELMGRTIAELHVDPRRVIGSAPSALESAVRALAALECDGTGVDTHIRIVGVPPNAAVAAWQEAMVAGQPASAVIAPHRMAAISARLPSLWPPGPFVLASAAARVVEAVVHGSRRRLTCFVALAEAPNRGTIAAMPARLGPLGLVEVLPPTLSRQERTLLENGLVGR